MRKGAQQIENNPSMFQDQNGFKTPQVFSLLPLFSYIKNDGELSFSVRVCHVQWVITTTSPNDPNLVTVVLKLQQLICMATLPPNGSDGPRWSSLQSPQVHQHAASTFSRTHLFLSYACRSSPLRQTPSLLDSAYNCAVRRIRDYWVVCPGTE